MAGSFTVQHHDDEQPLPGIPVTQSGDPVERTYVLAHNRQAFGRWCRESGVRISSDRVFFLSYSMSYSSSSLEAAALRLHEMAEWPWVVFLGIHPRQPYGNCPNMDMLETRRRMNILKRAWFYPHLNITPSIVSDSGVTDGGREW